jgi:hypothetical protein
MADEETNIRRPYAELGLVWLQIWQTVKRLIPLSPIRYPAIRPDLAGGESDAIQSTTRSANRWGYMTVATLATATSADNRKAVIAGTIGNVLEWYDFGVYGFPAQSEQWYCWIGAAGSSRHRQKIAIPASASILPRSWPTPELRLPNAAAQTRIVSKARIRLDSGKSVRSFKGIICVDISEFESYMPSQAVGLHAPVLFWDLPPHH